MSHLDEDLRLQILRASVRDRQFLATSHTEVNPADFPKPEEEVIASAAIEFWKKYEEPIGAMLKTSLEKLIVRRRFGPEDKKRLRALVTQINTGQVEAVSVRALKDRVFELKQERFWEAGLETLIQAQENGKLTAEVLSGLYEKASHDLTRLDVVARDYFETLPDRIARRKMRRKKPPALLIDELDRKIEAVGRGHLAMFLAPYASGKGLALIHVTASYALQGLNVLHITLEDPIDVVENRFDASLCGIALNRLAALPNKLKKRFERVKEAMRGRIRLVDGTQGGWTVTKVTKLWEDLKQTGFTADAIVIDYDDEIECERTFKEENARRFEFAEIYRRLRRMAANLNVIVWTAAQGRRDSEGKRVITGKDAAEDISKLRKVFLGLGIGSDPDDERVKHLFVMRHKTDRSRFGVDIVSNFDHALFYDRAASRRLQIRLTRVNGRTNGIQT